MYTERRSECRYKRDHFCAVARCLVRSRPPRVSMLPDYAELDTHTHTRARARVSTNTHTYLLGLLGTSEQLVTEVATYKTHTKKKNQETNILALSCIRISNPSIGALADLRLRPHGHHDLLSGTLIFLFAKS